MGGNGARRRGAHALAGAALAIGAAGLAGCGSDDDIGGGEVPSVSRADYDTEAERLCRQHGRTIQAAYVEVAPDSDAEEAAFYRTEFIPRIRALVNTLAEFGVPDASRDAYVDALNRVNAAVDELEADPFGYIDDRHARNTPPDEDLLNRIRAALDDADVPC